MNEECSTHEERKRMHTKFWSENRKEGCIAEELGIDGRKILNGYR
jgi:hypothetical protein